MTSTQNGLLRLILSLIVLIGTVAAFADPNSNGNSRSTRQSANGSEEQPAPADTDEGGYKLSPKPPPHPKHYWLLQFEIGTLGAVRSTGSGYTTAPWISWNPTIPFTETYQLRGKAMFAVFKNATAQYFSVTDFEALFALAADGGFVEIGGGIQNWSQNGGAHPVFSGNIAAPFDTDLLGFLDRFVIGYSAFLSSPFVHELHIGVGVAF